MDTVNTEGLVCGREIIWVDRKFNKIVYDFYTKEIRTTNIE